MKRLKDIFDKKLNDTDLWIEDKSKDMISILKRDNYGYKCRICNVQYLDSKEKYRLVLRSKCYVSEVVKINPGLTYTTTDEIENRNYCKYIIEDSDLNNIVDYISIVNRLPLNKRLDNR